MACKVPIVSTRIPVIDEIIQDGETGILARLNDVDDLARKIIGLLKDDALRQRLAANGRARVEACYTETLLGERTEQVYCRVLNSPPYEGGAGGGREKNLAA
jgi:glycosyltransferase involved in cell wall biosynthesis